MLTGIIFFSIVLLLMHAVRLFTFHHAIKLYVPICYRSGSYSKLKGVRYRPIHDTLKNLLPKKILVEKVEGLTSTL